MDIKREQKKNYKKLVFIGLGTAGLVAVTIALMSLRPAAPTGDGGGIYTDTVKRGEMGLEVRGPGTLTPQDTRFITAVTAGRRGRNNPLPTAKPRTPKSVT